MFKIRAFRFVLTLPFMMAITGMAIFMFGDVGWTKVAVSASLFVVGWLLMFLFAFFIVCPKCEASPYSFNEMMGKPWPNEKCWKCGFDFSSGGEGHDQSS